ncbi:MAG TPA: hypothetical protein VNI02_07800 [Blastocatellia bacterium]|jgi:hypothetical protein|nr:hypothetical protein [Blastocatellia bacterium]
MIFDRVRKKSKGATGQKRRAAEPRLHSISAVLKQRDFVGSFDVAGAGYRFSYIPSKADLSGQKLQLRGRLEITDSRGGVRVKDDVRALLVSAQGGIGAAPIRRQVLVGGVADSTASTSGQQQQIAGEKTGAATNKPDTSDKAKAAPLPEVESTGPLSFCGAMYFHLEPLNGGEVGVAAGLSRVQLNVRLAPVDERGREMQGLYSSIVDALYGHQSDGRMAATVVGELNKLLVMS